MSRKDRDERPRLLLTMGDAAGIGPEVLVKALGGGTDAGPAGSDGGLRLAVVGDPAVMEGALAMVRAAGVPEDLLPRLAPLRDPERDEWPADAVPVIPLPHGANADLAAATAPDAATGRAAAAAIEEAVRMIRAGLADAVVTSPVSKEALHLAGYPYPGQTEFLAALTGTDRFCMGFVSERLRVALVTTHLALRDVPDRITPDAVARTIEIFDEALRHDFGVARPRIAVCALNPHAGEAGLFGDEETRVVAPGIEAARRTGADASGPHPADTIFRRAMHGEFDGIVALYHDQGLAALKAVGTSVNVTLGLPIVRASVDHGIALDIARRGIADAQPTREAIHVAARMVHARRAAGRALR